MAAALILGHANELKLCDGPVCERTFFTIRFRNRAFLLKDDDLTSGRNSLWVYMLKRATIDDRREGLLYRDDRWESPVLEYASKRLHRIGALQRLTPVMVINLNEEMVCDYIA